MIFRINSLSGIKTKQTDIYVFRYQACLRDVCFKDRKLNDEVPVMEIRYKIELCSENDLNSRHENKAISIIALHTHTLKHQ
jgi:hypothetical protein